MGRREVKESNVESPYLSASSSIYLFCNAAATEPNHLTQPSVGRPPDSEAVPNLQTYHPAEAANYSQSSPI